MTSRSERRLGLYGGSFDPVHGGHLAVARAAADAFALDRVVFVPAARPPHKPGRRLAPGRDRAAMLALALADEPRFEVSTLELERDGPSYTIDTVRALPAAVGEAPDVPLYLVLGSDNLPGLPGWRAAEELLERVVPVVVLRAGDSRATLAALAGRLAPALLDKLERGFLVLPPVPGRSSDLRAALGRGERQLSDLPPGVREYAAHRGLYGLAR